MHGEGSHHEEQGEQRLGRPARGNDTDQHEMNGQQHDQQRGTEQPAARLRHVVTVEHAGQEQAVAEQGEEQAGEQHHALDGEHDLPRREALCEGNEPGQRTTHENHPKYTTRKNQPAILTGGRRAIRDFLVSDL